MSEGPSETLTQAEAARRAGKSERTILAWIKAGKVGYRGEKPMLVDRASLEDFLLQRARKEAGNLRSPSEAPALPASPDLARVLDELAEVRAQLAEVLARLPPTAATSEATTEGRSDRASEADLKDVPKGAGGSSWWDLWARIRRSKWYNS